MIEYGYFGLFVASFLAATVVPFSSEALFAAMLAGNFNIGFLLLFATLGNWLGGMSSYWLGMAGKWEWIERFFRVKEEKVVTMIEKIRGKSSLAALFCWLPLVGDVIALALGFMKADKYMVGVAMLIGKFLRYYIIYKSSSLFL